MLDPRLRLAADFVREGSRVADIGTDHAHLPIALVQEGRCPSAIASDIRQGPVANARRNVDEAGLGDVISVRLGNGLQTVSPDETDDILILGMGGETIAAILDDAPWVRSPHYRLILQPMTRAEKLRAYLFENGFALHPETVTCVGGHWYTVLCAEYSGVRTEATASLCFVGRVPATTGDGYLQTVETRLQHGQDAHPTEDGAVCLRDVQRYRCGEWRPWEETV